MSTQLTPEALRDIADWLDQYDAFAAGVIEALSPLLSFVSDGHGDYNSLADDLHEIKGTDVQDDLRRWADEFEEASALFDKMTEMVKESLLK
jgi:hypothetical protein